MLGELEAEFFFERLGKGIASTGGAIWLSVYPAPSQFKAIFAGQVCLVEDRSSQKCGQEFAELFHCYILQREKVDAFPVRLCSRCAWQQELRLRSVHRQPIDVAFACRLAILEAKSLDEQGAHHERDFLLALFGREFADTGWHRGFNIVMSVYGPMRYSGNVSRLAIKGKLDQTC